MQSSGEGRSAVHAIHVDPGELMDLIRPLLYLLNFLASFVCILSWFALFAYVSRWQMRWAVDGMQSRLHEWASESGYMIFRQERPAKAPLLHRIAVSGPLPWLVSPRDVPWAFDLHWRTVGICVPTLSTFVILEDRQRRLRRGTMKYFGRPMMGFWGGLVESRWEEDTEAPVPTQQAPGAAGVDPLWDRWVDS
jgi:hypothetical protein